MLKKESEQECDSGEVAQNKSQGDDKWELNDGAE